MELAEAYAAAPGCHGRPSGTSSYLPTRLLPDVRYSNTTSCYLPTSALRDVRYSHSEQSYLFRCPVLP
eukprot:2537198-Rhodomonas_salina.3